MPPPLAGLMDQPSPQNQQPLNPPAWGSPAALQQSFQSLQQTQTLPGQAAPPGGPSLEELSQMSAADMIGLFGETQPQPAQAPVWQHQSAFEPAQTPLPSVEEVLQGAHVANQTNRLSNVFGSQINDIIASQASAALSGQLDHPNISTRDAWDSIAQAIELEFPDMTETQLGELRSVVEDQLPGLYQGALIANYMEQIQESREWGALSADWREAWGDYVASRLPFTGGFNETILNSFINDAVNRTEAGTATLHDYETIARALVTQQNWQAAGNSGVFADAVARIGGYAAEFAVLAPMYRVVSGAVTGTAAGGARALLGARTANALAQAHPILARVAGAGAQFAGFAAGTAAHQALAPGQTVAAQAQSEMPSFGLAQTPGGQQFVSEPAQSPMTWQQAAVHGYGEIAIERSGAVLTGLLGRVTGGLMRAGGGGRILEGLSALNTRLVNSPNRWSSIYRAISGQSPVGQALGIHGFGGELLEERGTEVWQYLNQTAPVGVTQAIWEQALHRLNGNFTPHPDNNIQHALGQLGIEAAALGTFVVGMGTIGALRVGSPAWKAARAAVVAQLGAAQSQGQVDRLQRALGRLQITSQDLQSDLREFAALVPRASQPVTPPLSQYRPQNAPESTQAPTGQPVAQQADPAQTELLGMVQGAFGNAALTPRGEIDAEIGGRVVHVNYDAQRDVARIDFEDPAKAGVGAELRKGSMQLMKGIRQLVKSLRQAEVPIEYRAIDTNRGGFKRSRADIYARMLKDAGYEQAGPPVEGVYLWKPKAAKPSLKERMLAKGRAAAGPKAAAAGPQAVTTEGMAMEQAPPAEPAPAEVLEELTAEEAEVLKLKRQGLSFRAIGKELGFSHETAANRLKDAQAKMGKIESASAEIEREGMLRRREIQESQPAAEIYEGFQSRDKQLSDFDAERTKIEREYNDVYNRIRKYREQLKKAKERGRISKSQRAAFAKQEAGFRDELGRLDERSRANLAPYERSESERAAEAGRREGPTQPPSETRQSAQPKLTPKKSKAELAAIRAANLAKYDRSTVLARLKERGQITEEKAVSAGWDVPAMRETIPDIFHKPSRGRGVGKVIRDLELTAQAMMLSGELSLPPGWSIDSSGHYPTLVEGGAWSAQGWLGEQIMERAQATDVADEEALAAEERAHAEQVAEEQRRETEEGSAQEPTEAEKLAESATDFEFGFGAPVTSEEQSAGTFGGGQEGASQIRPQRVTALANAQVDQERVKNQLPVLMSEARKANAQLWDEAMAMLDQNPEAATALVEELFSKPRATTAIENALLLHRKIVLANEHRRTMLAYTAEMRQKQRDDAKLDRLDAQEKVLLALIDKLDRVTRTTGTEWGRAGQFRRQLAAEDFSLAGMLLAAQKAKRGDLTQEEKRFVLELHQKISELEAKIAELEDAGTLQPGQPSEPGFKLYQAKGKFQNQLMLWDEASAPFRVKAFRAAGEVVNVPRSLITAIDFALFRQGWISLLTHPIRTAKAVPAMFRGFVSEEAADREQYNIENRPNALNGNYDAWGVDYTRRSGPLNKREEGFVSRLIRLIPHAVNYVTASERGYIVLLNTVRADTVDAMAATLARKGKLNGAGGKIIANFANVATGRGPLGKLEKAATILNQVFFAPKWAVSRFQFVLGQPLYAHMGESNAAARLLVLQEYGRFAAGLGVVFGLLFLAGFDMEEDPRSADFGKLRIGNTRLDLTGGLASVLRLLAQTFTLSTKTSEGDIRSLHGPTRMGQESYVDVLGRFLRGKLAPTPGAILNVLNGTDVVGQPVTAQSTAAGLGIPLFLRDVYEVIQEEGIPRGAAMSMMALFGMGMQTYNREKQRAWQLMGLSETERNQAIGNMLVSVSGPFPQRRAGESLSNFQARLAEWRQENEQVMGVLQTLNLTPAQRLALFRSAWTRRGNSVSGPAFGQHLQRLGALFR